MNSLSSIAKKLYKIEECDIKELKNTGLGDLQDIIMDANHETCPINYASTFKYSLVKISMFGAQEVKMIDLD